MKIEEKQEFWHGNRKNTSNSGNDAKIKPRIRKFKKNKDFGLRIVENVL